MKNITGVTAQEVVEVMKHHNHHTEELLGLYPDLMVNIEGDTAVYYSTIINAEVNEFAFDKETTSTYCNIYTVHPYKNVRVGCSRCEGLLRVNSTPSRIPLFLEHENFYNREYIWYGFVYEEVFKSHGFSPATLSESQMYILKKLNESPKANHKIDIYYLNNSIKKLLPFT